MGLDLKTLLPAEKGRSAYFAQDRKGNAKDTSGETAADDDAYELIMKDKERLLDPQEPVKFIFSHSALQEGWDNPNVFQICVLRNMGTERWRRQSIGRGLRLCVDGSGNRVHGFDITGARGQVLVPFPTDLAGSGMQPTTRLGRQKRGPG